MVNYFFVSKEGKCVLNKNSTYYFIFTIDLLNSPLKMALQEAGYNRYNYLVENISLLQTVYEKKIKPEGDKGWVSESYNNKKT